VNLVRGVLAGLLLALLFLSSVLTAVPVYATPPSQTTVQNAISKGKVYLNNLRLE